ncbi:DUF523 domain-containing protein [Clostridium merdae]|uniref:DUF523 domain-containing protein n=1 Tax=Clostridium merdae TaxID=1958780 RepID=UPI000A26A02F|nr:DUF523 domain-containing protein [Clostridium merdae]
MKVLVSACLVGENCKYNGGNNYDEQVMEFLKGKEAILICPELLAGLGAPRNSCEIVNGRVFDNQGNDLDEAFREGVRLSLQKIGDGTIDLAILQPRSPTCGVHQIYDGTFTGKLIPGQGVFAAELIKNGVRVIEPSELQTIPEE